MELVRLGVVGTGLMGARHVELIHACDMRSLVGLCSVDTHEARSVFRC